MISFRCDWGGNFLLYTSVRLLFLFFHNFYTEKKRNTEVIVIFLVSIGCPLHFAYHCFRAVWGVNSSKVYLDPFLGTTKNRFILNVKIQCKLYWQNLQYIGSNLRRFILNFGFFERKKIERLYFVFVWMCSNFDFLRLNSLSIHCRFMKF